MVKARPMSPAWDGIGYSPDFSALPRSDSIGRNETLAEFRYAPE